MPRAEWSGEHTSFAPFDNVLLDLGHRPAIAGPVSKLPNVRIPRSTHVVNRSIALRTDRLG